MTDAEPILRARRLRWLGGALVVSALCIGVFYTNEARKEVVFLCGNFTPGVSEASVLTQLETINFSRYEVVKAANASAVIHTALRGWYRCRITIDANGLVSHSEYRQATIF